MAGQPGSKRQSLSRSRDAICLIYIKAFSAPELQLTVRLSMRCRAMQLYDQMPVYFEIR
jgi:hypothetical protein